MPATNDVNLGPANTQTVNTQAVYEAQTTTGLFGNYASAIVTAASTNDFTIAASGFPTGIAYLDINPSSNAITLTGMLAGIQAQQIVIRNIGSTYTITLSTGGNGLGNSSSQAANQFVGVGDVGILPGGSAAATYYTSPSAKWSIGGL